MIARWLGRVGGWRLSYEISLTALVTVAATTLAAVGDQYPAAPWLVGLSTPVVMVLRLTHPIIAYVAAALIGLGTGGQSEVLLVVLSASLAYRVARWWQVAAALAVAWAGYVAALRWSEPLSVEWVILFSGLFAMVAVVPAGVARLVRRRRVLLATMHRRNQHLHDQQSEIARQAQARERTRIARDLHDSLGHKLTLISLYSGMLRPGEGAPRPAGDADPDETAALVRQTSSAAMAELRQILGILGQDDTQSSVRPLTGLDELADQARATGAEVTVERDGEPRPLAALTEHAAYRVIQEGLTNALRHARGSRITLQLRYDDDALVARVTNTAGQRATHPTTGQGLLGLTERVRVAGGMLYAGPAPDGGFRLAATLPYLREEAPAPAVEQPQRPETGADFAVEMDRHRRRSRLLVAVTTVAIAGSLTLCLAGVFIYADYAEVDQDTYDAVRIGQPEHEVRALLPDTENAATDVEGGRPVPGAVCVDYQAPLFDQLSTASGELFRRFCFRDGVLVDKQSFE
jgi:signal transduction histidine kinase